MERLRTVAHGVGLLVLLLAVLLAILIAVPGLVGAEGSYVVTSDSMSPAINAGDMVVVRGVDATDIDTGSVITFRSESMAGSVVTHRVVEVVETGEGVGYRTKGDANEEADRSLVKPGQVVGSVWFTLPLVGHLVAFAQSDLGIIALVVVPALLLLGSELYALFLEADDDEEEVVG